MNLNETLNLLALQLTLNPDELIHYAAEDVMGGYHIDESKRSWKMGSIWEVEGKTLYALIRILKPEVVVELGSWEGCSTTHIATALSINGRGHVTAVDIDAGAGGSFPPNLTALRTTVTGDAIAWLATQPDESIDFLFEDTSHSADMCAAIASLCKTKLAPGGVLVMHDAGHDFAFVGGGQRINSAVGLEVRTGIERALGNAFRVYLAEPSDCGLAVWQKPGFAKDIHSRLEKPKNDFVTADGEHLKVVSDDGAMPPGLAQAIDRVKAGDPNGNPISAVNVMSDEDLAAAPPKAFEDMTRAELVKYAEAHDIDLTGAKTNVDRVAKITEAEEENRSE